MDKNIYLAKLQPDPQDPRDFILETEDSILPEEVDMREYAGIREDQLSLGSCTAASIGVKACEMFLISAGLFQDTDAVDDKDLSILFNYATSRKLLSPNTPLVDGGSTARMALKAAKTFGVAREKVYPYILSKVNDEPPQEAYDDAKNFKIDKYSRIALKEIDGRFSSTEEVIYRIKYALAKGWPVALGLRIGEKLRDLPKDEVYTFVNPTTNPYWGNHEMLIVGYTKDKYGRLCWIVQNSWGKDWGDNGFFLCLAGVAVVDVIDLWAIQGFNGIERVGKDLTQPKPTPIKSDPIPTPVPPVPDTNVQPIPTPPIVPPVVPPAPVNPPKPEPKKKDEGGVKVLGLFILAVTVIKKIGKYFERK